MIVNNGHLLFTYKKPTYEIAIVTWSPDGKWIACSATDNSVLLLDAETGSVVDAYDASSYGFVEAVLWSPDSHQLVSCYYNGQIIAWDLPTGTKRFIYQGGEDDHLIECALSLDGTAIASSGMNTNSFIQIWHVETGVLIGSLESQLFDQDQKESLEAGLPVSNPYFKGLCWSPGGQFLALGQKYKVHIWQPEKKDILYSFSTGKKEGGYDDIRSIAWSPNEQFLALAGGNNVEIWTIDGKKVLSYSGHKGPILNCVWISGGKQLVSISRDSLRLWDGATGEGLAASLTSFLIDYPRFVVQEATLSPDKRNVVFGGLVYLPNNDVEGFVWVWEHGIDLS